MIQSARSVPDSRFGRRSGNLGFRVRSLPAAISWELPVGGWAPGPARTL